MDRVNKITEKVCEIVFKRLPGLGLDSREKLRAEIAEVVTMIAEMVEGKTK